MFKNTVVTVETKLNQHFNYLEKIHFIEYDEYKKIF